MLIEATRSTLVSLSLNWPKARNPQNSSLTSHLHTLTPSIDHLMSTIDKMTRVAETDSTFSRNGNTWQGKCFICNGHIAFDARTGEGATLEHIRARTRGGTDDLDNLALVHGRCNWEKGRRWDPKQKRSNLDYEQFLARLLVRRKERWRDEFHQQ